MAELPPLTFTPILKERIWGGRRLAETFGKPLPERVPIGESWEITDRPEGVSVVASGPFTGRDLRWLMAHHGHDLLGRNTAPDERFPWLIKLLDCTDDLSLQVHPPAHKAATLRGEPKTEMWYFADTRPGSRIYVGLRQGVTRDGFWRKVSDGTVADCFHAHDTRPRDAMFVPSGRVHALGGGNLVFEIQQNSDTTYRVFDWNRVGLDGKPRELHLEASMASIDFDDFEPGLIDAATRSRETGSLRELVRHPLFHIDELQVGVGGPLPDPRRPGTPGVLGVVQGHLTASGGGETVHVPAGGFVLLGSSLRTPTLTAHPGSVLLSVTPGS